MGTGTAFGLPEGLWDRPEVTGLLDRHDIGALLDVITKESKLSSQHKLAAATGFTQTQISHYISGLHRPTLDSVKRIAHAVAMPSSSRQPSQDTGRAGRD